MGAISRAESHTSAKLIFSGIQQTQFHFLLNVKEHHDTDNHFFFFKSSWDLGCSQGNHDAVTHHRALEAGPVINLEMTRCQKTPLVEYTLNK